MAFKKFNEYLDEKNKLVSKPKDKEVSKVKIKKNKEALGHEGDDKLIYEPKTTPVELKNAPDWHKSKTREWLEKTKKMSLAEFAKNVYTKDSEKTNEIISKLLKELDRNPKVFESLVRNIKRANLLEGLVEELSKLKEIKSIFESVSKPIGFEDSDMEDSDMEDDDMEDDEEMSPNRDMENDLPLGRRKNSYEKDYFSEE